jgi:hypothetical protein
VSASCIPWGRHIHGGVPPPACSRNMPQMQTTDKPIGPPALPPTLSGRTLERWLYPVPSRLLVMKRLVSERFWDRRRGCILRHRFAERHGCEYASQGAISLEISSYKRVKRLIPPLMTCSEGEPCTGILRHFRRLHGDLLNVHRCASDFPLQQPTTERADAASACSVQIECHSCRKWRSDHRTSGLAHRKEIEDGALQDMTKVSFDISW